jgi:hypothetical protein
MKIYFSFQGISERDNSVVYEELIGSVNIPIFHIAIMIKRDLIFKMNTLPVNQQVRTFYHVTPFQFPVRIPFERTAPEAYNSAMNFDFFLIRIKELAYCHKRHSQAPDGNKAARFMGFELSWKNSK